MKLKYILSTILFLQLGCASMGEKSKADLEKELTPQPAEETAKAPNPENSKSKEDGVDSGDETLVRYSDLGNMAPPTDRQYKRMTRQRMEEESELNASAGSLWKMDGQKSFLFAENKQRRPGDTTSIKLEGSGLKVIEGKAWVINDLLGQMEEQKRLAEEEEKKAVERKQRLAQAEAEKKLRAERIAKGEIVVDPLEEQQTDSTSRAEEAADAAVASRSPAAVNNKDKKEDKIDLKEVESIPAKIVEKLQDDVYRIRGFQYLTIRKKPYKVIATALVRAEDFNDSEISSNKLLEAEYDLVHLKRASNE
jgi:flagellar L-ring protein precursor FlgH